jgi:8-amino-7-oxononanoate synthase
VNPPLEEFCERALRDLEGAGLLRRLREAAPSGGRAIRVGGREVLNFASNDYLGLAFHPRVTSAAAGEGPSGATASRLLGGNHPAYAELEGELASFKRAAAALVFSSGYAAAVGTLPALAGRDDFIVMDKLCHACLVDAARLSGATLRVFPHNDVERCGELLAACAAKGGGKVLLVTESVFSMDGDLAPLDRLAELKRRHGAWLLVDEAHGTGVLGANGRGGAEHFGVEGEVDVAMGTLSKALGSVGGYVAGSAALRELLVNRARSLIFSTGLPPSACRAASAALRVLREDDAPRRRLAGRLARVAAALGREAPVPIVPVPVGDERRCVALAEDLFARGGWVPAVRFPTVPRGKARLRLSLSAAHTDADLEWIEREVFGGVVSGGL